MSAGGHTIAVPARFERARTQESTEAGPRRRAIVRTVTFAAFSLYGIDRWATLMRDSPGWRLFGLWALAVALVAVVGPLSRRNVVVAGVLAGGLMLAAFPMAGLRWHWFVHLQIAHGADRIGNGLEALPNVLVPYLGTSDAVRLVIVLGAGILLAAAAAIVALVPRRAGDAWRAAAALPLLVLAVVPSTLVAPRLPYLHGFVLFALLAAFLWAERVRRDGAATALVVIAVGGLAGAVLAPRLDTHRPWVDYRSWTGTIVRTHVDTFNWNQTYGPLRWPRAGHQVLTVHARTGDYWKAEDLDDFNGREWVRGDAITAPAALPRPGSAAVRRFSQTLTVSLTGMRTLDVIGAGYTAPLRGLEQVTVPGPDPGTWVSRRQLGPGTSYSVRSYSPRPTADQLRAVAGRRYPQTATLPYRTLAVPQTDPGLYNATTEVTFPTWHGGAPFGAQLVNAGPYARVYALARRLSARAATPYDFVAAVKRYLGHGYTYDEHPPNARYPLVSFLFGNRHGYCQQFSGAMAMLLRMGGIPARVASGFTSGAFDNESHSWQVSDTDAHAWVEAWFPRYGWVRFDPTPTNAPARAGTAPEPIERSLAGLSGSQTTPAVRHEVGVNATDTAPATRTHRSGISGWLVLAGVILVALLGVTGWVLLRPARSTDELLAELQRAMARTGRPLGDEVTLAQLERRLADTPGAVGYVRALRLTRYGAAADVPTAAQRRALRHQLAYGLGVSGRLRALWALPPRLRGPARRRPAEGRPHGA